MRVYLYLLALRSPYENKACYTATVVTLGVQRHTLLAVGIPPSELMFIFLIKSILISLKHREGTIAEQRREIGLEGHAEVAE